MVNCTDRRNNLCHVSDDEINDNKSIKSDKDADDNALDYRQWWWHAIRFKCRLNYC